MKRNEEYALPLGGYTTDIKEYAQEWDRIGNEVEVLFGTKDVRIIGFDPGVLMSVCNQTFTLPMVAVKKLLENASKKA